MPGPFIPLIGELGAKIRSRLGPERLLPLTRWNTGIPPNIEAKTAP